MSTGIGRAGERREPVVEWLDDPLARGLGGWQHRSGHPAFAESGGVEPEIGPARFALACLAVQQRRGLPGPGRRHCPARTMQRGRDLADQRRPAVDQAGVNLHQVGAGVDLRLRIGCA